MTTAAPGLSGDVHAPTAAPPRRWAWLRVYFAVWFGYAAMYLLVTSIGSKGGFLEWAAYTFTSWGVRALALLPAVWLAARFPLNVPRWPAHLVVHAVAAPVLGAIKGAGVVGVACVLPIVDDLGWGYVMGDLPFNILAYSAVIGAVHAVGYYRGFLDRERAAAAYQLRASRLEGQLARAQLDALKMQLHPHFLFNTLNSISALIHDDPLAADQMVSRLSEFLRLVLDHAGAQEVRLKEEMHFLERYLEIQQTRFRHRLRPEIDIDPGTLDARVPTLLLQPLVENAIRHAVEPRAAGASIRVRAWREDGALRLEVRDDGPGMGPGRTEAGRGMGLANTRARLERLYGAGQTFALVNDPAGGLVVSVSLPYRAEAAE